MVNSVSEGLVLEAFGMPVRALQEFCVVDRFDATARRKYGFSERCRQNGVSSSKGKVSECYEYAM